MIPVSLTLQGLYSYQERQTIDFTRLTQAHLFGIFGTVGSGKSSILEAITFALYGESERLNNRDNKNYNMMNLKSNELYIDFEFKAGPEETLYKATVRGKRNSKRFSDVPTLKREAYTWTDGAWQAMEVEQLETHIGLNYDNFKRTVIIPQGRFQEFLQLGSTERTRMMKELFNLDRFELSDKVAVLDARNTRLLENLEGQLLQLADVQEAQLAEMEVELSALDQTTTELTDRYSALKQQEEALRGLKTLTEKWQTAQLEVQLLQAREPDIKALEDRLSAYEYCLMHFKPGLDAARTHRSNVSRLDQVLAGNQSQIEDLKTQLKHDEAEYKAAKTAFDQRESLRQQQEELGLIVRILTLTRTRDRQKDRILEGDRLCKTLREGMKTLTNEVSQRSKDLKALKATQPDLKRLMAAKAWFEEQERLTLTKNKLWREQQDMAETLRKLEQARRNLLRESGLPLDLDALLDAWMTAFSEQRAALKEEALGLQQELEQLMVQHQLKAHAARLKEGEPCPLCGATSHPAPFNAHHLEEALQATRQRQDAMGTASNQIDQLEGQLRQWEASYLVQNEAYQKLTQRLDESVGALSAHQTRFQWTEFSDKAAVDRAWTEQDQRQEAIEKLETTLEKLNKQLDEERGKLETYTKTLDEQKNQETALSTEISTLTQQLKVLKPADFEDTPTPELERRQFSLGKALEALVQTHQQTLDALNATQQRLSTLVGQMEANRTQLKQEEDALREVTASLEAKLGQSSYATIEAVEQELNQPIRLDVERKTCTDFRMALQTALKTAATLQAELGDRSYSEDTYQEVTEALQQTSEALSEAMRKEGALTGALKNAKDKLATKKELEERTRRLRNRAEEIKTLKQLFKANGFVNYISTVYLQELCRAATTRFYQLTRQHLSLEITNDNNFQVRDHINGGKVRSVKTLSGGQTFQASLSLALALADNIQQLTATRQNFFFLDEGFGSLDKESLDIVFDALKSLRKENRIVGVISHVDDMQQEIDTHLRVVNDETRGSLISTSWEC